MEIYYDFDSTRSRDGFIKPFSLAITITVLVHLTRINQFHYTNEQKRYIQFSGNSQITVNIRHFLYQSIVIVSALASICRLNNKIQLFSIILVNCFLAIISITYFHHHLEIIYQPHLIPMITVAIAGYGSIFFLDLFTKSKVQASDIKTESEASIIIRRKIFHIAPLVILPFLAQMNVGLVQVMLCGSFYILFNLQLVRYTQSFEKIQNTSSFPDIYQGYFKQWLNKVFNWMGEFNNTRESGFWFTHLYLYLTLILSFEIYPKSFPKSSICLLVMFADGAAALVGSLYGKIKIYKSKTLQGLCAFIFSMFMSQCFLSYCSIIYSSTYQFTEGVMTGLCQLLSGDLDNILCVWVFVLLDKGII